MDRTVAVGYPHLGPVEEAFCRSLAETCLDPDTPIAGIITARSARQTVARNTVIQKFLDETPAKWLMWVDTDMQWGRGAINTLLRIAERNNVKQVAGAAFIFKEQSHLVESNAFVFNEEENTFAHIGNYKPGKTLEVHATGSAFVLIHREVFEWWREQWGDSWHFNWDEYEHPHPRTGKSMGHDLAFFYRTTVEGPYRLLYSTQAETQTAHIKKYPITQDAYYASRGETA